MARDPNRERWPEVYRDTPEVFARFGRAEDRDDEIPRALLALAGFEGSRVLEIGAGTGRWSSRLHGACASWVATEPARGMLALGREETPSRVRWLKARSQSLPFAMGSFERGFAGFVFANLRPKDRAPALAGVQRVLAPGGELWLLENHWDDEFQELRRSAGLETHKEIAPLTEEFGFEHVSTVDTRMEFESADDACEVLGTILGPLVTSRLQAHPQQRFLHRVCLLRWRAN